MPARKVLGDHADAVPIGAEHRLYAHRRGGAKKCTQIAIVLDTIDD